MLGSGLSLAEAPGRVHSTSVSAAASAGASPGPESLRGARPVCGSRSLHVCCVLQRWGEEPSKGGVCGATQTCSCELSHRLVLTAPVPEQVP